MIIKNFSFIQNHINLAFLKYVIVGSMNAVFTCIIYSLALLFLKFHYLVALSLAWLLGMVFTYILNFLWVFKPESNLRFQERFAKYFATSLTFFSFNLVFLYVIVSLTHYDPFYVQLGIIPIIIFANYIATKLWSMRISQAEKSY